MNIPTGHPISNSSATQKGRIKTAAPSPSPSERPLNPFRLKSQRRPSAAAHRTAWNSRRPHSRVALTWGSRLSGYRAWAEPCTRQRVCPEERKMEASGDLDRSSLDPASAALSANMEIRQWAENRRSGWKCDWAFQKRLLKKRGQREEFGIGNENGSDSAIRTDTTSQTFPVHE